jgi:PTH1 family peptidyl-tRNA hydrolase
MFGSITFLGNPGEKYAGNRHNVGRLFASHFAPHFRRSLNWQHKYKSLYTSVRNTSVWDTSVRSTGEAWYVAEASPPYLGEVFTDSVGSSPVLHLLMPETYMNLSGESVKAACDFFKLKPEHILVVQDELELPLGAASFKFGGGLGGHNGLRSIKACLGTADFWRLRIGIGRPNDGDILHWVLSDFSGDEKIILGQVFDACVPALLKALQQGPESLLPEWNKKKIVA